MSPAAYWSSWADALPMMFQRDPVACGKIVAALQGASADRQDCIGEAVRAQEKLVEEGLGAQPTWQELAQGARPPPPPADADCADAKHGWQYVSSSTRETFARTNVLRSMCRRSRAILRSQSGPGSSFSTLSAPTNRETTLTAEEFQVTIRRRLLWPLSVMPAKCEGFGASLDKEGNHRAACMRSGRVKLRAAMPEKILARICREAGGRVRENVRLSNLNLDTRADDDR